MEKHNQCQTKQTRNEKIRIVNANRGNIRQNQQDDQIENRKLTDFSFPQNPKNDNQDHINGQNLEQKKKQI